MFSLEREIGKWRKEMIKKRWISRNTLNELEEHLRDEIETQKVKGASSADAYDMAVRQIGKAEHLSREFRKVYNLQYWGNRFALLMCVTLLYFGYGYLQKHEVVVNARFASLDALTNRNEFSAPNASGLFIELLPKPHVNLILDESLHGNRLYFDLWVRDEVYHGICLRTEHNDVIYIDSNKDLDLTNDEPAIIFPFSQNSISAEIPISAEGVFRFQLFRKPTFMTANFIKEAVGSGGQLRADFVHFVKMNPFFSGDFGTYFFLRKINSIRGSAKLNDQKVEVAICDVNLNGLYDDAVDKLLVDLNADGKLNLFDFSEMFNLTDNIRIGKKNFRLNRLKLNSPEFSFVDSTPGEQLTKSILWSSR